jgi:hypothetical protein
MDHDARRVTATPVRVAQLDAPAAHQWRLVNSLEVAELRPRHTPQNPRAEEGRATRSPASLVAYTN